MYSGIYTHVCALQGYHEKAMTSVVGMTWPELALSNDNERMQSRRISIKTY